MLSLSKGRHRKTNLGDPSADSFSPSLESPLEPAAFSADCSDVLESDCDVASLALLFLSTGRNEIDVI